MKYATVKDIIVSCPHPILPTVQGEPDYQTIRAIRKLLQANSRAINTHLGGGAFGHLGLIVSDASYAIIDPATDAGPTLWVRFKLTAHTLLNYSHSRIPPCAPTRTHGQIQAPRENPTKECARACVRCLNTEPNYYYCPITLVMS
jgi:hypothetical protein